MSNFSLSSLEVNGLTFATVEHYFQAEKCRNKEHYEKVRLASTPAKSKTLGRSKLADLRPDWEEVKPAKNYWAQTVKNSFTISPLHLISHLFQICLITGNISGAMSPCKCGVIRRTWLLAW